MKDDISMTIDDTMSGDNLAHSVNLRDLIYNDGVPAYDDPAENYFEASKLTRPGLPWETPGIPMLLNSPDLQSISRRAGRRYASRPFIGFECPPPLHGTLHDALYRRRSAPSFSALAVSADELHSVLHHSYGSYAINAHEKRRNTPSGGALYPLDIFVLTHRVNGLTDNTLYHYDPFRNGFALIDEHPDIDKLHKSTMIPDVAEQAAVTLIISATMWRSRFKYSQRSLRFILMEAGHLAQNLLLTATSLDLATRLFGGFVDDEVTDILVDHNGVDDAPVYMIMLGQPG